MFNNNKIIEMKNNYAEDNVYKPSLRVYLAAISSFMGSFCMGCVLGWTSPAFDSMEECDSEPRLTSSEDDTVTKSWIGSSITIAALVGGALSGKMIYSLLQKFNCLQKFYTKISRIFIQKFLRVGLNSI